MGIKTGKYLGKIVDYGIGPTSAGLPQIIVKFEWVDIEGEVQSLMWFGSLKEKALPYTMSTIVDLGFKGSDPLELAGAMESGLLNVAQDYELTVGENDFNGKKSMRIQFVNIPGSTGTRPRMTKEEAMALSPNAQFAAALAEARAKKSQPVSVVTEKKAEAVPF